VVSINQVIGSILSGCAVSCGALLAVAGASKVCRGVRGVEGMTAVRRALRMPRRRWRLFGLAAGGVECPTGILVCSGTYRVAAGAALAALGAVFCALLAYVLVKQIPGGCGCIRWRTAPETATETLTWRAMARSGMLLGVGSAYLVVSADAANGTRRLWFGVGVAAGGTVLALLSMPRPVRTPVCRRPLWRQARTTLRALADDETFTAMAASAGPFQPVARYRRIGCADEFWFTARTDQGTGAVVFRVHRAAPGARFTVHASLQDVRTPEASRPSRAIPVADVLTKQLRGPRDSDGPRSRKPPALATAGWAPPASMSGADVSAPNGARGHLKAVEPVGYRGRRYEVRDGP
jgi:hypothetical protein